MTTQLDESHSTAWRLFLTAYVTVIERIEQELAEAELPPLVWYDVLLALKEAPDHRMRMHALARTVLLTRSNITRLVDRLETAGLLCRKSCPTDRRGAFAVLTDEGLAMQQRMWPVYAQGIAKYFATYLKDTEVNILTEAMKRVLDGASKTTKA